MGGTTNETAEGKIQNAGMDDEVYAEAGVVRECCFAHFWPGGWDGGKWGWVEVGVKRFGFGAEG